MEFCCICDEPTGRAGKGEDSIYDEQGRGPFCEKCDPRILENVS